MNLDGALMSLFYRVFSRVWSGESQKANGATGVRPEVDVVDNATSLRVAELEAHIEEQKRHIARAKSLLQNAAFLAGYHQPSLEREIRALLAEIEAGKEMRTAAPGIMRSSSQTWSAASQNGTRTLSA